jgi:2-polyprenyl-3-methyl-5-hydroxy-6-metoxy-1,4-benzoquinol methylase
MPDPIANRPIDVPIRETLGFLISHVPVGAKILEVGCGDGEVACELLQRGYHVTGLDSDSEAITRAQARGVRAVVASWPEFDSSVSFDAIAFTRSLHHINPLRQSMVRARELLNPNGSLLIEDFALDEVNEATVAWFAKVLRSTKGKALINRVADQLATALLSATDIMQTWRDNRVPELHSFKTMNEAIAEQLVICEAQSAPYFYRYLIPVLPETAAATSFVDKVFQQENILASRGEIVFLGRRVVASA